MAEKKKWFRVTDPLNPLCGCDVRIQDFGSFTEAKDWWTVEAMRRVDVFIGDRPFQLIAREGENLGLMVDARHLVESPLQATSVGVVRSPASTVATVASHTRRADGRRAMLRIV